MLARWNTRMYSTICKNQQAIISAIYPKKDVQAYESLLKRVGQASNQQYQRDYKDFWRMHRAQLGTSFYQAYFNALNTANPLTLRGLCKQLDPYSKRSNGAPTLQFSFATKLRHMINPQLPIYDVQVGRFFLFREPSTKLPWDQRVDGYIV